MKMTINLSGNLENSKSFTFKNLLKITNAKSKNLKTSNCKGIKTQLIYKWTPQKGKNILISILRKVQLKTQLYFLVRIKIDFWLEALKKI